MGVAAGAAVGERDVGVVAGVVTGAAEAVVGGWLATAGWLVVVVVAAAVAAAVELLEAEPQAARPIVPTPAMAIMRILM